MEEKPEVPGPEEQRSGAKDSAADAPRRSNELPTTLWGTLALLGPRAILAGFAIYSFVFVVLFVLAYWENRQFDCFPFKLSPRKLQEGREVSVAGVEAFRDSLLIATIVGRYPDGRSPSISVITPGASANQRNAKLFRETTRSIRTVTVHGRSWLYDLDVLPDFKAALKRADVELLVVDPTGAAFSDLLASDARGFEGRSGGGGRLRPETFREAFEGYRELASDSTYGGHLALRYYSEYPWIRFSIFDDARATFVLVPFLKSGRETPVFYTEDPWVVECLGRVFDRYHASSRSIETDEEFRRLWTERRF